jgi:surface polysaccharide O-acyltransferase-like enzyme
MTARLHYLDALRSCAMLLGLLVHAGTLAHEPVSSAVNVVSEHFRMATFFVVSGFFAALLAQRRGPIAYVRARVAVLLVPLCTGLVLLNPLTNWLIYLWHAGPVGFGDYLAGARPHPSAGPQVWHLHLWFLVSLSVYVALVPLVAPILRRAGTGRLLARLAGLGLWLVPALAVLVVAHEIGMRGLWRMTLERPLADTPLNWLPRVTATYWVYFVIGMAAATHQALFEAMHRFSLPTFAAGFALYAVLAVLPAGLPRWAARCWGSRPRKPSPSPPSAACSGSSAGSSRSRAPGSPGFRTPSTPSTCCTSFSSTCWRSPCIRSCRACCRSMPSSRSWPASRDMPSTTRWSRGGRSWRCSSTEASGAGAGGHPGSASVGHRALK